MALNSQMDASVWQQAGCSSRGAISNVRWHPYLCRLARFSLYCGRPSQAVPATEGICFARLYVKAHEPL